MTREQWLTLWHHLCARYAELKHKGVDSTITNELHDLIVIAYRQSH